MAGGFVRLVLVEGKWESTSSLQTDPHPVGVKPREASGKSPDHLSRGNAKCRIGKTELNAVNLGKSEPQKIQAQPEWLASWG